MADLLFVAGFLAAFTGYCVHTALHYRTHRGLTGHLSRGAGTVATMIIGVGYAGFGLMLFTDPVPLGVPLPAAVGGGLIGIAGMVIFGIAVAAKHGFEGSEELVTTGIFARLRHPMYLGILLIHLGLPFLTGSALTLLSAALWAPQVLFWRRWEDEELEKRFGERYLAYEKQTLF